MRKVTHPSHFLPAALFLQKLNTGKSHPPPVTIDALHQLLASTDFITLSPSSNGNISLFHSPVIRVTLAQIIGNAFEEKFLLTGGGVVGGAKSTLVTAESPRRLGCQ